MPDPSGTGMRPRIEGADAKALAHLIQSTERHRTERDEQKHAENQTVLRAIVARQDGLEGDIRRALAGFPDDDPAGHRTYHDNVRRRARKVGNYVEDMVLHAGKITIVFLIVSVLTGLGFAIKQWWGK